MEIAGGRMFAAMTSLALRTHTYHLWTINVAMLVNIWRTQDTHVQSNYLAGFRP